MAPIACRLYSRGGRDGAIAQLGERVVRNDEVGGSIPPGSTSLRRLRLLRLGKPHRSEGCRAVARRAKADLGKPYRTSRPFSLPRKSWRPLFHETRDALAKIAAAQRHHHLPVGVDGGFGKGLER